MLAGKRVLLGFPCDGFVDGETLYPAQHNQDDDDQQHDA
jgi:hypothetical protein